MNVSDHPDPLTVISKHARCVGVTAVGPLDEGDGAGWPRLIPHTGPWKLGGGT